MVTSTAIRAGKAVVELLMDRTKFDAAIDKAQHRLKAFADGVNKLGNELTKIGAAGVAGFAVAGRIFANYADQISLVRAVAKGTREELDSLDATAKRLGATTSFTASQVAALMVELGRGGMSASEINAATQAVLDLARATATETGTTAGIVVSALRSFGLAASESQRVADVLTAAANGSFNTLESLGEAFVYAGVTAAQAGMSIEETSAILMTLGNVGIQGSMAGTTLRRLLTITAAEAEKLKEIFGVSFRTAAGDARPLVDVLGEINEATKDLGSAERAAAFNAAFGLLGITGAQVIAGATGDVRKFTAELEQAGGTARRVAQEMDDNLGGGWRMMLSALEGVAIAVGEAITPAVRTVMGWIESAAGALRLWVQDWQGLVTLLAVVAGGTLAVGLAIKTMVVAANVAITALTALKGAYSLATIAATAFKAATAHPYLLALTAAVTAVVGAVGYLTGAFHDATVAADRFAEAQRRTREEGDQLRAKHQEMLARLDELAAKQNRTKAEQDEARNIVAELSRAYHNLGVSISSTTGEIEGMAGAQERLNEAQRQSLISQLRNEQAGIQAQIRAITTEMEDFDWGGFFTGAPSDERLARDTALNAERTKLKRQSEAIEERIARLRAGQEQPVAGETAAEDAPIEAPEPEQLSPHAAAFAEAQRQAALDWRREQDREIEEGQRQRQREEEEAFRRMQEINRENAELARQLQRLEVSLAHEDEGERRRALLALDQQFDREDAQRQGLDLDLLGRIHAGRRAQLERELAGSDQPGAGGFGSFSGMAAARQFGERPGDKQVQAVNQVRNEVAKMRQELKGAIRDAAPQVV